MESQLSRKDKKELRKMERKESQQEKQNIIARRIRNKRIINFSIIGVIFILIVFGIYRQSIKKNAPGEYDNFAKCLTQKGAIMYGTDWCPHCQKQKELFGNSFQYVNFVNCETDKTICDLAGIKGYPTWTFKSESPITGEQQFSTLAERTGCVLQ